MRKITTALNTLTLFSCLILFNSPLYSQVSNLIVNGSAVSFTMTSGDTVSWSYDLPSGATASVEIWIDINGNQLIEPGTDKSMFIFTQIDGDTIGLGDGPPDMDGLVNGMISFSTPVGLAPTDYILKFTHGGVGQSIAGTVTPLLGPAFTISGTVSGPPGVDVSYMLVEVSREGFPGVEFWDALTDSMGDYTIEMDGDTAGNPWSVSISDPTPPYTVSPGDTDITIDGNITGINFTLIAAAAQVVGQLLDETGDSLAFTDLYISRVDTSSGMPFHYMRTDPNGRFWFGISAGELNGNEWEIAQAYNENALPTTHMLARGSLGVISDGDSLVRNLLSYTINSSIDGLVRLNGLNPGFPVLMFASNRDSAESLVWSDSATGSFSVPVSNMVTNYQLSASYFPGLYDFPQLDVSAGDAGVIYNITTTGVEDLSGDLPTGYTLGQNYPNPFNPVTTIPYSIPSRERVLISVFDVLGREVAILVNEIQEPGSRVVTFDAGDLPSGVYSYRITSGTVSQVRKMLILR